MRTRCLGCFFVMWVTKLLISPGKIRIFCPKLAFLFTCISQDTFLLYDKSSNKESSYSILSVLCISLCSYFRMKRGRVALLITITVAPYLLLSGILSIKQLLEEKTRKAKDVDGIYNFSANELNVEGEHDVDLVFSLAEVAALPPPVPPSPSCAPSPLPSRPSCEGQTGGKLKNEKRKSKS